MTPHIQSWPAWRSMVRRKNPGEVVDAIDPDGKHQRFVVIKHWEHGWTVTGRA